MQIARTTLPPEPGSVPVARRWAATFCEASGAAEHVDTVMLLLSELVTNSVIHGRSELTVELQVTNAATAGREAGSSTQVRVSVADDDSRLPQFGEAHPDAMGGRGLHLVRAMATRYGVQQLPCGKSVYFELDAVDAAGHLPTGQGEEAPSSYEVPQARAAV